METQLIPIEYRPIKKIVVIEVIALSIEELFKRAAAIRMSGQRAVVPNWAEGVVFLAFTASPEFQEVNENAMKGVVYFASVLYAPLPRYVSSKKIGPDQIPVIDQSNSLPFRSLALWLKQRSNA
jgi:hypothetical protein